MLLKNSLTSLAFASAFIAVTAFAEDHPKHKEGHKLAKDVDAFHAVLSPLWHTPKGTERTNSICAQTTVLENLAKAITSTDAKKLQSSITVLKGKCQANPLDVDTVFSNVHDEFHHIEKH
jgi:hypothetical protein